MPNGIAHVTRPKRRKVIQSGLTHISLTPPRKTELDGVRRKVFLDRYSQKDALGEPTELYPEQLWERVAKGLASVEAPQKKAIFAKRFYETLEGFKFVPGGRILSGAGTPYKVTYYNCFVIPSPHDSRGGIIDNLKIMVEIMSRSGGVGINLSSLRPRGARVFKVNGTASGPVNWAELYSVATHDVIQQGGSRRGALMVMLNDWHPDIEEFITVKKDLSRINGANLSVCVSDPFMEAVKHDADWQLVYPEATHERYDDEWDGILDTWQAKGYPIRVYKTVKARKIWNMICESAWASAEPGLHFIDRSNKLSNTSYFERLISTNPCGEQPLGAWSVCNLGAMNLSAFVLETGEMDYENLARHTKVAIRMLDNVVDANHYFFAENAKQQLGIRRTGLGTMGLGDALIKMQVRYGSPESIPVIEKIYTTIRDAAYESSIELAREKGPFPLFDKEQYLKGVFIKRLPQVLKEGIAQWGIRNAVVLTQAPTGTTSLFAGVSSGIEPVYDFAMIRRDRTGEHVLYHPLYKSFKDAHPDEKIPNYFVAANDLTPEDHVRVQATIQYYTDSSISKTVNAPHSHTVEDVKKLYTLAYDLGLKGVTYMRDGSREGVLSHLGEGSSKPSAPAYPVATKVEIPVAAHGLRIRKRCDVGNVYTSVFKNETGRPIEVFVTVGKSGAYVAGAAEVTGRLSSLALRYGASVEEVADELIGISCGQPYGVGATAVLSLFDAVGKSLAEVAHGKQLSLLGQEENGQVQAPQTTDVNALSGNGEVRENQYGGNGTIQEAMSSLLHGRALFGVCPDCQSPLIAQEGCATCINPACGFTKCE